MSNNNPKTSHLTITRWRAGQSGNPKGKSKGTKHLSTWIKELLENDNFEYKLHTGEYVNGAPIKAILSCLIIRAIEGDCRAFDLLAKYGYGNKVFNINNELPMPIIDITKDNYKN